MGSTKAIKECLEGKPTTVCFDCAEKYRDESTEPYEGTYTTRVGICKICNEKKRVSNSLKLFGLYRSS